MWGSVDAFAKEKQGAKAVVIPENSQLGIFVQPKLLMAILSES
jgi:hypothetical protein